MKKILSIAIFSVAISGMISCKKDLVTFLPVESPEGKANLKIIHASAYAINYSVQLKINDVRVSSNITNATPFPGGGLNTGGSNMPWYLAVNTGTLKISQSVAKVGSDVDSIPLFSGNITVEANKYYSAYLTDTATNTQLILVNENVTPVETGFTRYKFVNIMPNLPALDLYFGTTLVASNIAYKGSSAEFKLVSGTQDKWYIRPAGAAANSSAIATYPAAATLLTVPVNRIMTVFARGYNGSTGNRAPNISFIYN